MSLIKQPQFFNSSVSWFLLNFPCISVFEITFFQSWNIFISHDFYLWYLFRAMMSVCFFQRPGIWLGLVSKYWLPHRYQNYPESPPPPRTHTHTITEDMRGYINSKNSIWIGQLSVKSSVSAMLETGAMSIRRKNKPFFRTPVIWNLEQIMSTLIFHPN